MSTKRKLHASIIVTYRCNAKCNMCNVWRNPTRPEEEIGLEVIRKLPRLFFANITGGEPFIRRDLPDLVQAVRQKARRVVISTNGYFSDRIISLCRKYPDIGIRISLEGLPEANDGIRGIPNGFERGLRTILELAAMGIKDIGLAMTIQERNCRDLLPLYQLAKDLGYEFATAALHNSHYFCKLDNDIGDVAPVVKEIEKLVRRFLRSRRPKDWFRAYFNWGLINYIHGNKRVLPCGMGSNGFFVDPWGDILACNGMDRKEPMGNLKTQSWDDIWNSPRADEVRRIVRDCPKRCWMIGSAAPAMWQDLSKPLKWVFKNKLRMLLGRQPDLSIPQKDASS